ncbi:tRNA lysidine(34) synthetase TilS [Haloechinothrix halophila]|uniref:tRNA lysidine(34) synthetase TilS n=1 Tax=Haloechinothrix halophila TaxID=1069073 RepID=UPI00041A8C03|nr:tRNA lysidine(34) synthetase TilS [Haloechinothrix halophila]
MVAQSSRLAPAVVAESSPGQAALQVRAAVSSLLDDAETAGLLTARVVGIAVSGGPDSLALADAAAYACGKRGLESHALIVDHGLQASAAAVARETARTVEALGVTTARVLQVEVSGRGGVEAAARRARYGALADAVPDSLVLLGHTRDDQAETVLLGLGRGSGPRSICGMRPLDPPWARPLLDVPRASTVRACAELGVLPWQDPHNADSRFTRARLRAEVLPLLEEVLQGGVAGALARTATQLREDCEALDALAADLRTAATATGSAGSEDADSTDGTGELDVVALADAHAAVRRRALRAWLLDAGASDLTDGHLRAVDELVSRWRGQGGVWLPGDLVASRAHGKLRVCRQGQT